MSGDAEKYQRLVNRFIALANNMKDEGLDIHMVADAMMFSSAVYITYTAAGNEGGLTESGIEKVTATYQRHLLQVQELKRQQLESGDEENPPPPSRAGRKKHRH